MHGDPVRGRRGLSRERRGVIEMPLELTIIVLILAIMLPIIYGAAVYYNGQQSQVHAKSVINEVSSGITQAFLGDVGTRIVLTLGGVTNGYIVFGGALFSGCTVAQFDPASNFISALTGGATYNTTVDSGTGTIPMTNLSAGGGCTHWRGTWTGYTFTTSNTLSLTKCWALNGTGPSAGEYSCSALPPSPAPTGTQLAYFVEVATA